jgi:hypothetical protein
MIQRKKLEKPTGMIKVYKNYLYLRLLISY